MSAAHAYLVAALGGSVRRSGETYVQHGNEVAATLREFTADASLLSIALLHDLPVRPDGEHLLQASPLSRSEQDLVRGMHQLRRLHIDESTEDLDRVIAAFMQDARLLPLRMAHRLNDVRHLARFRPGLRKRIARETLHMYTSIAGRLGMHAWRYEMEEICFPVLHPAGAAQLRREFESSASVDQACLDHARAFIGAALKKRGIACTLDTRIKGLYSTYRKMIIKHRAFHEMTDRLALRIVTSEMEDCYRVLGIVHSVMHPIPGKLKDYIGAPKENGYRSIHTVVYPLPGVTERPIEVQIRTQEMHRECEFGVAAHGEYKTAAYALQSAAARVNLFRNLRSLREEAKTPAQFEQVLRRYFRADHIAVFDHHNNLYHLPKPATALDVVCHAHPGKLARLRAVRVNGRERRTDTVLSDGDIVEALFGRRTSLRREWMHAVAHAASKRLIRDALRKKMSVQRA